MASQYCFIPDQIPGAGRWQINTPPRWPAESTTPKQPVVLHFCNQTPHRVVLDFYINDRWMKSEKPSVAPGGTQIGSQGYMHIGQRVRAREIMTNQVVDELTIQTHNQMWFCDKSLSRCPCSSQ